ncbi:MAG: cysW, partial [Capsulimonas sp.]|nr:cysW [Capsulimonas sp.]
MAETAGLVKRTQTAAPRSKVANDPLWLRVALIGLMLVLMTLFLILPLIVVFHEALAKGWAAYGDALKQPETLAAVRLTLLTAAIVVPLNVVFGVSAAWAISK